MSVIIAKRRVRTTNVNSIKRIFQQAFSYIDDFDPSSDSTIEALNSFRDTLAEKFIKMQTLNDEISYLIEDESELEEEENSSTDFTLLYRQKYSRIIKFIDKALLKSADTVSNPGSNKSVTSMVKLPPLKLKSFDGSPELWQTFFENFQCAVDANEDLSEIQKLTYLRSLLEGPALSTITGLALTNNNYNIAINLLRERYDNKQLLISSHMRTLLSLERVTNIQNIPALRRIYDNLEIQIRSLENLGITSLMYGPLLVPVLMQKIPQELNIIISRSFNETDCWDISVVLKVLKSELQAREKSDINSNDITKPVTAETLHSSVDEFKKLSISTCVFCEQEHKPQNCKNVTNIEARKEILKRKRRCLKCLRLGHFARQCSSRMKCFNCSRHHHASMCQPRPPPPSDNKQDNGKLTSVAGTSHSVLLQTAMVDAQSDANCISTRILFDSCSQLSYVSPSLRSKLKLPTIDSKEIKIRTFGNNCVTEILDMVQFSVRGLSGSLIPLTCFVKEICAPLSGQNLGLAVQKYKHLRNLNLADHNVENNVVDVEILVGADFYWKFFGSEIISGDSGPVALKCNLGGYVLSGGISGGDFDDKSGVFTSHVLKVASEFVSDDLIDKISMNKLWDSSDEVVQDSVYNDFCKSTFFDKNWVVMLLIYNLKRITRYCLTTTTYV